GEGEGGERRVPEAGGGWRGLIKPDIIFFGESLGDKFSTAMEYDKQRVDLLLVLGSSLKVGPVNKILQWLPARVPQVLINREVVGAPNRFDVELLGDCDAVVRELWARLGWEGLEEEGEEGGGGGGEGWEFAGQNRYYFVNAKRPVEETSGEERGEEEGEGGIVEEEVEREEEEVSCPLPVVAHHEGETETEAAAVEAEEVAARRRKEEDWEVGPGVLRRAEGRREGGREGGWEGGGAPGSGTAMPPEGLSESEPLTVDPVAPHHQQLLPLFPALAVPQSPHHGQDLSSFLPPALLSPLNSPLLPSVEGRRRGEEEEGKKCRGGPGTEWGSKSGTPRSKDSPGGLRGLPSPSCQPSPFTLQPMSPRSNTLVSTPRGGTMTLMGREGGAEEEASGREGGGRLAELEREAFYLP
ncbi:histone deacetylase, partial [Nannochloropsis gaditana]